MFKKLLFVLAISLLAAPALAADSQTPADINSRMFAAAKANVKSVSPVALKSWIEEERDFILLDVREPDEVKAARIESRNLVEIPRGVVEFLFPQRGEKADTTIVVYCLVGNRSAVVAGVLRKYGYKNVYNLDNGIVGWIKKGYPVANFIGSFEMKNLDSLWLK